MTDHYELLGVEPDASKDEIKAAYRAEVANADSSRRAQLNRAWNVLSDPIQRERYDESLAAAEMGDDVDESGTDVTVVVPSRRTTGARRGDGEHDVVTRRASTNGSSKNGERLGGHQGRRCPPKVSRPSSRPRGWCWRRPGRAATRWRSTSRCSS